MDEEKSAGLVCNAEGESAIDPPLIALVIDPGVSTSEVVESE